MYKSMNSFKKSMRIIEKNSVSLLSRFVSEKQSGEALLVHMPVIKRGKGPYLYDYDENRFVDFYLACGALLLGHSPPRITKVIKSWVGRGYSGGYPTVSHQMLSQKIFETFMKDLLELHYTDGKWFFYDSPFEAALALLSLLERHGKYSKGVYLTDSGTRPGCNPLYKSFLKCIKSKDLAEESLSDIDYVIIGIDRFTNFSALESLLKALIKKGKRIVSDETTFESYVHLSHHRKILNAVDVHVYGSWVSGGLPFGCIFAKNGMFRSLEKSYDLFCEVSCSMGFPPLFKIKSVVRVLGDITKNGGVEGLLLKYRAFYEMLTDNHFEMVNNMLYIRRTARLFKMYRELHLLLLKHGLYFPIAVDAPISLSYSHSGELLKKCAKSMNQCFDALCRK